MRAAASGTGRAIPKYGKQGHLVTLVDRRSRYFLARRIPVRTKAATAKAVISMLKGQPGQRLTLNNGIEFADYGRIEKKSLTTVYFADPYASWQRGSNENANGRLRRWIPRFGRSELPHITGASSDPGTHEQSAAKVPTPYEVPHKVSVSVYCVNSRSRFCSRQSKPLSRFVGFIGCYTRHQKFGWSGLWTLQQIQEGSDNDQEQQRANHIT